MAIYWKKLFNSRWTNKCILRQIFSDWLWFLIDFVASHSLVMSGVDTQIACHWNHFAPRLARIRCCTKACFTLNKQKCKWCCMLWLCFQCSLPKVLSLILAIIKCYQECTVCSLNEAWSHFPKPSPSLVLSGGMSC